MDSKMSLGILPFKPLTTLNTKSIISNYKLIKIKLNQRQKVTGFVFLVWFCSGKLTGGGGS